MKKDRIALLSVFYKDGIVEFAQALIEQGFKIFSSGGTFNRLTEAKVSAEPITGLVGGGAILGHKVVTLSRQIHAGLLASNSPEETAELAALGIPRIDLVCVDLYPMAAKIADPTSTRESVIEMTDIGGPAMVRSAAKGGRIVICDCADRQQVIDWLKEGEPDNGFVQGLCAKGEYTVAKYCLASADYLSGGEYAGFIGRRVATCQYGENAHQTPAHLFSTGSNDLLALDKFSVVEGAPPSHNNWVDIDRLLQTVTHLAAIDAASGSVGTAIAVGVKHGNTCGASVGKDRTKVLKDMMLGDPLAIFGGLIMLNFELDESLAECLVGKMLDGIVAPAFTQGAIDLLRRKGDKCRFIANLALGGDLSLDRAQRFRNVRGGFLLQPNYTFVPDLTGGQIRVYGEVTPEKEDDMLAAWAIGSTSNSNTITLVKNEQLIGNGVGQQDRVGAAKLAVERARRSGHDITGASAYSDSFFPFPDGPQVLIGAGVKAIFTSSGSVRDKETIDLCVKNGVVLYMVPDAVGRGFFGH